MTKDSMKRGPRKADKISVTIFLTGDEVERLDARAAVHCRSRVGEVLWLTRAALGGRDDQ